MGENITKLNILLTLISIGGVYLLTLNHKNEVEEKSYEAIGYFLMLCGAFCYGTFFVILRKLSKLGVDLNMAPFYLGVGGMIQIFFVNFIPGQINYQHYRTEDFLWFFILCCGQIGGQIFVGLTNEYSAASKMAPINYSENVITLLADILIFNYQFVLTDAIGMTIIVI